MQAVSETVIRRRCLRLLMCLATLPSVSAAAVATAAPAVGSEGPAQVDAIGTCPGQEAVAAALEPVLRREPAPPLSVAPRVIDLGDRFEVVAAGQRAQYVDPARDCRERARTAAVFIALALNPPELPSPPPEPLAPRAPATVEAAAPPSTVTGGEAAASTWMAAGAAARIDGAWAGDAPAQTILMVGGEIRGAVGRRGVALVATAGVLAPATARFEAVPVRQQRFPCSLGVTATGGTAGGFQVAGDAAVVLAPFTLHGEGLQPGAATLRLDVGARLALAVRSPPVAKRSIFFVEVHAEAFPRPYHLDVGPLGTIGTTSKLWLGAAVGAWFGGP